MRRALVIALLLAGCGGGIGADEAREAVERAAGTQLREQEPPAPEVEVAYTAAATGQFVQLFVLGSSGDAETMSEAAPPTEGVRTELRENVFVVVAGPRADAVVRAVEGL